VKEKSTDIKQTSKGLWKVRYTPIFARLSEGIGEFILMKEGNVLWWWEGNSQCKQFLVPM
jgi:hypothetical protein